MCLVRHSKKTPYINAKLDLLRRISTEQDGVHYPARAVVDGVDIVDRPCRW